MPSEDEQQELIQAMLDRQKEPPFSPSEIRKMRRMLDEYEKAAWLKKKVFVMAPWLVTIITAVGGGLAWFWNGGGNK